MSSIGRKAERKGKTQQAEEQSSDSRLQIPPSPRLAYRLGTDLPYQRPSDRPVAPPVTLDGSNLEGGGQILRMGMALAAVTGQPLHIHSVRGKRSRPGLQPQHLAGVELVRAISNGRLEGAFKGSCDLSFHPGPLQAGHFYASPETAGSTALLVQASLPCLLMAQALQPREQSTAAPHAAGLPSSSGAGAGFERQGALRGGGAPATCSVHLGGGTDNPQAPPVDFLLHALLPLLRKQFGIDASIELRRRGFYPRGGGDMLLTVAGKPGQEGSCLPPIQLVERGAVVKVHARAHVAGQLPRHVAQQLVATALAPLTRHLNAQEGGAAALANVTSECIEETASSAHGTGAGILLVAETSTGCLLAGSALLGRGQLAADMGRVAGESLVAQLEAGGCIDEYMQDQLVIFMALAKGTSRVLTGPLTLHTKTAIWVAQKMTAAKFRLITADQYAATGSAAVGELSAHEDLLWAEHGAAPDCQGHARQWILECVGAGLSPVAQLSNS